MAHPLAKYVIASVDGLFVSRIVSSQGIFDLTPDCTKAVRIPTASVPYVRADFNRTHPYSEAIVFTDGYNYL